MNPLTPQTVFVPIDVQDELPAEKVEYFVIDPNNPGPYKGDIYKFDPYNESWVDLNSADAYHPSHWLKEQSLYTFTKEQLIAWLGSAFDSGRDGEALSSWSGIDFKYQDKEEYIKQLLP